MSDFQNDKEWSDRFIPEIKCILGGILIGEPPIEEDMERNTDLVVLKMEAVRIGCRIRRHEYIMKYGHEFTIRYDRPSGAKTEFTKIVEGWGQYLFYGFSDRQCHRLFKWYLINLNEFRLWLNRSLYLGKGIPGIECSNGDNSSKFYAFNTTKAPAGVVYAYSQGDS